MKLMVSEEYYRLYWGEFLKPVPGEDYVSIHTTKVGGFRKT